MTQISSTIDLIGKFPAVLYHSNGNNLPVNLPYVIFEANEPTIEVDCSQIKDSWSYGMIDDLVASLNRFLGTSNYELELIGIEEPAPFMIRVQKEYPLGAWSAQPLDYDMDDPIGYGDTIQEAIAAFIETWNDKGFKEITNYKWIGKQGMWG